MKKVLFKNSFFLIVLVSILYLFLPFFPRGHLPIPADTIVGLYHPFRDLYADNYPNGIPFKNFLITDPVRQLYPWKELALEGLKRLELPLWNPYEMGGKPLLGNFQSSPFYPLNIFLVIFPFSVGWSVMIFVQPLLAATFLFLYLRRINLHPVAATLGALAWSLSGFSIAWLEWNTVLHTLLWLPLILLSTEEVLGTKYQVLSIKNKKLLMWIIIFTLSLCSSLFAGHIQTFFYLFIFSIIYFLARWIQFGHSIKVFVLFLILNSLFIILTSIQWFPTFQFILLSARNVDQIPFETEGWFLPWQHLVQFVAPDFFGNPTTLNYWGTWNYSELVGYIGVVPFLFALFALVFRRDKKTVFFGILALLGILFATPTPFAQLPYVLNIPFLSTAQPTRLLSIVCLALSILAALGFDYFLKTNTKRNMYVILGVFSILFAGLWIFIFYGRIILPNISLEHLETARRNLILPTGLFVAVTVLFFPLFFLQAKKILILVCTMLLILTAVDLTRFAIKFEPFVSSEYLYPQTKIIEFLQSDKSVYRIATTDSRILPPNFSTHYRFQSIEGYDPLYLLSYAEFIASSERGEANIRTPFGFNRIITPRNLESPFIDLLNVKYVLSFDELDPIRFEKVLEEGKTKLYRNMTVLPRVFFVDTVQIISDKQKALEKMFVVDLHKNAVVSEYPSAEQFDPLITGIAEITEYSENRVVVRTNNSGDGFLVFSDTYYPTWEAVMDRNIPLKIYKTNYTFRGVYVPKGDHEILFSAKLF